MISSDLPTAQKEELTKALFAINKGQAEVDDIGQSWLETGYIHPEGDKKKKLFTLNKDLKRKLL